MTDKPMTVGEKTMAMGIPVEGPYFVRIKGEEKMRGKFDVLEDARLFRDTLLGSIPAGKVLEICDSRDYIERALYPCPREDDLDRKNPMTVGEKIMSKHDVLRDNLLSLYGRIGMLTEMQSYIEKEICETSNEIGHIKSLLKETPHDR